ncbi:MAG: cytochrome b [Gammaproteobacteria bacterium]|nr:cytochrome b [Gammaproteobacteria bacterium]MCW5583531.1 cytochrome b [Gammaproteobacteria bacterium]
MSMRNTTTSYGSVTKLFHWLIFLLVLAIIPLGYTMGSIQDKVLRSQVVNIHKLIGVSILILMLLRALWALNNIKPALPFQTPNWQRWVERCMHVVLYVGLIIMPLSGLIGSVAAGKPPQLGSIRIEFPVALNKPLAEFMFEYIHEPLALILIALISIHIFAALYHHFIKRDDILRRMMPYWRGR